MRPVFPAGKPAEMGELAREICEFVRRMRLRKDNRWLQEGVGGTTSMRVAGLPSGTVAVEDVCKIVAACGQSFQAQLERDHSSQACGSAGATASVSPALLAIYDGLKPESVMRPAPEMDPRGPDTMSVEDQLSLLRGDMERQKKKDIWMRKKKDMDAEEEPLGQVKKPAAFKKPAAAPKAQGRPRAKPKAEGGARKPHNGVLKRRASAASTRPVQGSGSPGVTSTGSQSSGVLSRAQNVP